MKLKIEICEGMARSCATVAVAKAAAQYVKKRARDGEKTNERPKAAPNRSARARGKAVASDAESDSESDSGGGEHDAESGL